MNYLNLLENVKKGEDSLNQFKIDVNNPDSLAAEIVSFLNTRGGTIYIGVSDIGELKGLSLADVRRINIDDRLEIISPGSLPNHLTVEKILSGNTNIRNPIIASFVAKGILPYHGLGSGVMRAKEICPDIAFIDDKSGVQFKVVVPRNRGATSVRISALGTRETILAAFRDDPTMSMRMLSARIGISLSSLQGHVAALKAQGALAREGGTRGRWVVL